jgi:hypothetical protein
VEIQFQDEMQLKIESPHEEIDVLQLRHMNARQEIDAIDKTRLGLLCQVAFIL